MGHVANLEGVRGRAPALDLIFPAGSRPSHGDMLAIVGSLGGAMVSYDPAALPAASPDHSRDWLELLADGMTFDLAGLTPGPGSPLPAIAYHLAMPDDSGLVDRDAEAIALMPGPHLSGGANALSIVRTWLGLGAALVKSLAGISAACWSPARMAIEPRTFVRLVDGWLAGGPFPSLALAGFSVDQTGCLRSEGMAFFVGQELLLDAELVHDKVAATRLAARLANELVLMGPVVAPIEIMGVGRRRYQLAPEQKGAIIRVSAM